jgi:hypothetical protein
MKKMLLLSIAILSSCSDEPFEISDPVNEFKLPSNPTVWMPFNSNFQDESPNYFPTSTYEVQLTSDQYGNTTQAAKFDTNDTMSEGSIDDLITIPHNELLNSENITLSAWVNPIKRRINNIEYYTIASRWDGDGMNIFRFQINGDGKLVFVFGDGQSSSPLLGMVESSINVEFNEWTHVTFTLEGSNYKFYINSELVTSGTTGMVLPQTVSGLAIGETLSSNGYWYFFNGKMDDFGMWTRPLNQTEIFDLFQL